MYRLNRNQSRFELKILIGRTSKYFKKQGGKKFVYSRDVGSKGSGVRFKLSLFPFWDSMSCQPLFG